MLEWKDAGPIIGVILTFFGGLIGLYVASRVRRGELANAHSSVPMAIAGAIAERGVADALTNAVTGLTAVLAKYMETAEKDRDEDAEVKRRRFTLLAEELARIRTAIEVISRREPR